MAGSCNTCCGGWLLKEAKQSASFLKKRSKKLFVIGTVLVEQPVARSTRHCEAAKSAVPAMTETSSMNRN
jgi:hypothetical protein